MFHLGVDESQIPLHYCLRCKYSATISQSRINCFILQSVESLAGSYHNREREGWVWRNRVLQHNKLRPEHNEPGVCCVWSSPFLHCSLYVDVIRVDAEAMGEP